MNTATFAGRLGRSAEIHITPSGKAVLNFSLAVDVGFGDNTATLWVGCALWGERAEKLQPYLVKGKQLTVSGDVNVRAYSAKDGTPRAELTLDVHRLTLQGGADKAAAPAAAQPAAKPSTAPAAAPIGYEFDDDIPF